MVKAYKIIGDETLVEEYKKKAYSARNSSCIWFINMLGEEYKKVSNF